MKAARRDATKDVQIVVLAARRAVRAAQNLADSAVIAAKSLASSAAKNALDVARLVETLAQSAVIC